MVTRKYKIMVYMAGVSCLLVLSSLTAHPLPKPEDQEKRLVEAFLLWAQYRQEVRQAPDLEEKKKREKLGQAELWGATAERFLQELRPDFSPGRTQALIVNQYVLDLIQKYQPQKEARLREELDCFRAEDTQRTLKSLANGLSNYQLDYGKYPESGNLNLVKGLSTGQTAVVTFDSTFLDQEGRILDAWGRPLVYRNTGSGTYLLYSVGSNGQDEGGAGDDIQPMKK
jgi:hypothetical protein